VTSKINSESNKLADAIRYMQHELELAMDYRHEMTVDQMILFRSMLENWTKTIKEMEIGISGCGCFKVMENK
jgi:hypothetical protein